MRNFVILLFTLGLLGVGCNREDLGYDHVKIASQEEVDELSSSVSYNFGFYDTLGTYVPINQIGIANMWKEDSGLPDSVDVINLNVNTETENGVTFYTLTAESSNGETSFYNNLTVEPNTGVLLLAKTTCTCTTKGCSTTYGCTPLASSAGICRCSSCDKDCSKSITISSEIISSYPF